MPAFHKRGNPIVFFPGLRLFFLLHRLSVPDKVVGFPGGMIEPLPAALYGNAS
jgi:hypothetical protein